MRAHFNESKDIVPLLWQSSSMPEVSYEFCQFFTSL